MSAEIWQKRQLKLTLERKRFQIVRRAPDLEQKMLWDELSHMLREVRKA